MSKEETIYLVWAEISRKMQGCIYEEIECHISKDCNELTLFVAEGNFRISVTVEVESELRPDFKLYITA